LVDRQHGVILAKTSLLRNSNFMEAPGYTTHPATTDSSTLRVTPAMPAGVTDHVCELSEVIGLLDKVDEKAA
jgi:hypothetical protein